MKKRFIYCLLGLLLCTQGVTLAQTKEAAADQLGIVPKPLSISTSNKTYTLPAQVKIYTPNKTNVDEQNVAGLLTAYLTQTGSKASMVNEAKGATITLSIGQVKDELAVGAESYRLTVDENGIRIQAADGAGLFYGSQTLMQLLPLKTSTGSSIPYVSIADRPAFKWRGSMLDVSRHFFSVDFVKKYIDIIASYKINTFHWHLTDDQGWRIEIKKYPKLTQISAFRKETLIGAQQLIKAADYKFDETPYGGFYTQEQIKDVIAYAQKRYVTIVPEIEMPGHSVAILAAYPELACKPGTYEAMTKWGVSEDIVCPTEPTFQFFENVLSEVCALFPGKYVHIGGDEAPKVRWKESAAVQDIMKKEGITDVEKVQGWFNRRIEKFLASRGKKLIGWDEILEGGITPSATVMSWRGEKGGIEAAKHGNEVVMSPTSHLYLDYGQNPQEHSPYEPTNICCYLPIERVYSYNPLSKELTPEQQKYIIGTQANLWTEYITTPEKVEYMVFPRLLAFSEVAWTPYAAKDYASFVPRMAKQFARLDAKKVIYRIPEPTGLDSTHVVKQGNKAVITLQTIVPNAHIRYTIDGSMPDETSDLYTKPVAVPANKNIKVRAVTFAPNGRKSAPSELIIP